MKRILLTLLLIFLSVFPSSVEAYTYIGGLEEVDKEIEELRQKIEDAQSQERSLNSEIKSMDQKIRLTELQITETTQLVNDLEIEINELSGRIEDLESQLSKLSNLLINRIVASYKAKRTSFLPFLFSSGGLTEFLNRTKYISLAQEHDRQVMTDVQYAKVNFSQKKELREEKKLEQERLKKTLEQQEINLNEQKKTKQALLAQTKNDEATYQQLLQQALAEKNALEAALISGIQVGPVKTGDPIALVGNTGYPACSTGAHLHFEVQRNRQWTNPGEFLKSRTVIDQQNGGNTTTGSGDWEWPLEGDIIMTQHYGQTPYSWRYSYSGGIHTGFDLFSNSSNVIRAPKDGVLYSSSQNCGGSSIIKIKYIEHGDGIISFYLHVQ